MRASFALGAFALGAASLLGTGCKMRGARYAEAAAAVDALQRASLAKCDARGLRPIRIQAFVSVSPDGHVVDVAIGRSTPEVLATCVKAALENVSIEPTGATVRVAVAFTFPPAPASNETAPFDRGATAAVLGTAQNALDCASENHGEGRLDVTFTSTGEAVAVALDDSSTPSASTVRCIEATFMRARIPPFGGKDVKVGKTFRY